MSDTTELVWVTTPDEFCSGGNCLQIAALGHDWFRLRSNVLKTATLAFTGSELRAFLAAVKAGAFDELVAAREQ